MKNRFKFGKFEILVVILLIIIVFSILSFHSLKGRTNLKFVVMKKNSIVFSKTVITNLSNFDNSDIVYLQEVIDNGFMKKIRNPMGDGFCSTSESFVRLINDNAYVTLKCGDILIDNFDSSQGKLDFYKVSDWSLDKNNDFSEDKVMYNCRKNGEDIFDAYYDEFYFVYKINQMYHTSGNSIHDISSCDIVSKSFYRKREKIDFGK